MGHPRTLALYVSAAMVAIVVAVLVLLRPDKDAPSAPPLPAQAAGETKAEPAHELNPRPAGRDLDWRAAVEAEPAGAQQPARTTGDPARAVHVFGFVHTPDGQLAKSVPLQWIREPHSSLQVQFARPPGSTEPRAEARTFNVVDGQYEGDLAAGTWVVRVHGRALTDDKKDYAPFAAPVPLLRVLQGSSKTQIDFEFRPAGTCSVVGTILDELGKPFGGLAVDTYELHALVDPATSAEFTIERQVGVVTNAHQDGNFVIPTLPPGKYRLLVEPQGYKPTSPPDVGSVGEPVPPREFVLSDGSMTVDLTIRRPHPVHVTGRVEIEPGWAAAHGLAGQAPTLELLRASGREGVADIRDPVKLEGDAFELWVDAGVPQPRLELRFGSETFVQPLVLSTTGEFAPLSLRIPR